MLNTKTILTGCMTQETEEMRQTGYPRKTWRDCVKNDMENLGLFTQYAQFRNKRRRKDGATNLPRFTWKMAVKMEWVYLHCSLPLYSNDDSAHTPGNSPNRTT